MVNTQARAERVNCEACPLRKIKAFRDFSAEELAFVSIFKTGELSVDTGATVLVEGSHSAHLYSVLSGIAYRYKILEDGRRQILNYLLPGDLVGLQGSLMGEMQHSVEALTPLTLCVFERNRITELYTRHPDLGYDLTWIASREERMLDEHLLSIGRRTALERAAYLLAFLHRRVRDTTVNGQASAIFPFKQQHVADTLGLSIVHTNKTLRKLADRGLIKWQEGGCEILNSAALAAIAGWAEPKETRRPFI
jgi:CRP/FNR family transcriptional regulator, anaerobic regulatory protein